MKIKEKAMSYIVWTRKCGKCGGQFYLEENEDGKCLTCIQCGRTEIVANHEMAASPAAERYSRQGENTRVLVKASK
jgi:hypothetical protein